MDNAGTLAFAARPDTIARLPDEAHVVPLRPYVKAPERRLVVHRPEDLLQGNDAAAIEAQADRVLHEWLQALPAGILHWRELDLADCFTADLELGVRDSLKATRILDRAIERMRPRRVLTDVAAQPGAFSPYPYLHALGALLESRAQRDALQFKSMAAPSPPRPHAAPRLLAKAYLSFAARQGLRKLREGEFFVGLGPFPEFYGPVAESWHRTSGGSMIVVTSPRRPMRAVGRPGLSVLTLEAFLTPEDRVQIHTFVGRAADALRGLPAALARISGSEDLGPLMASHLSVRFEEDLATLAVLGLAFERGLDKARAALAMETDSPWARAFVRYARRAGVPVTVLQHGVLAGTFSYRRTEGDRIAAWGPADAAWFQSNATYPVRAVDTGCPRYDALPAAAGSSPVHDLEDVPRGTTLVLFASQPFVQDRASRSPWERAATLQMALDAAAQMEGVLLVVKWHPAEVSERLPPGAASVSKEIRRGDALRVIPQCRAVLAMSSTVAFEAMALDRPVVFLGPADPASPFHPPEDGGGRRALTSQDLVGILRELLPDGAARAKALEAQRDFLRRNYAPLDGHAAERIVRLAEGR